MLFEVIHFIEQSGLLPIIVMSPDLDKVVAREKETFSISFFESSLFFLKALVQERLKRISKPIKNLIIHPFIHPNADIENLSSGLSLSSQFKSHSDCKRTTGSS